MQNLDMRGVTQVTTKAGLTAGTTTTYTTANAVQYAIDGKAYSKSAVTNGATPTTDVNTAAAFTAVGASKGCVFVFGFNAAGAIKVAQGEIVDITTDADGANASFLDYPEFPSLPDDFAAFGYMVTKVGASGTAWTFGSSNLAGPPSNVLHTFADVQTLPVRPQIS